jgi:hypothetical protein
LQTVELGSRGGDLAPLLFFLACDGFFFLLLPFFFAMVLIFVDG